MWMPTASRKGEDDHCWIKASRCLSTISESPLRPSYWLFRVATASRHISCINIIGCVLWLEKTCLHRCFHRIQRVIGMTKSNTTWDLALIGVEWILSMVERKTSCAFITKVIPSSWCSYLLTGACHDSQHTFPHLIEPCTWHNCNKRPTPRHIQWDSGQSHRACRIDSTTVGHATQLGELRFPHCHAPTGSDLCINSHWKVVIRLACCCFQSFCQNLVIIV